MCGICGIINFDKTPVNEEAIRRMMRIMQHRGPDDEGVFVENNVGLGFVRLSIIDLSSGGHQPKFSGDRRYVVVFNGEIYNYIELREELKKKGIEFNTKTDTEVLLNAYIYWGEDCLNLFNGMWAFVIYDRIDGKIFAARDRYGVKPLYLLHLKDSFAFCSEIPPLLSLLPSKPSPDLQSIFDYLAFNRTDQTESTFFKEIKKLRHGHKFHVDFKSNQPGFERRHYENKDFIANKWYDIKHKVSEAEGFNNPQEYRDLLTSAIGLRLRSDVPVGVCLSGGLDSSSIVSLLLKEYGKYDLNTFSAVYSRGQNGDETDFINEYRTSLKNMFFTSPNAYSLKDDLTKFVTAQAEPMPSTSPYAQYKVMELAKDKVVVTLDGQGADEGLAGYHYFFGLYFKELLINREIGRFNREIFYYLVNHQKLMGLKSLIFFLLPENQRTNIRVNYREYINSDFYARFRESNNVSGKLYNSASLEEALIDHFEYKLEHLLKWEDSNSMRFSLESRVPFLDYRLVERTLATTGSMKIRKGMTKYILREAMSEVIPERIRLRKDKMGFGTPQDEWFREPVWQNIIKDLLDSDKLKSRNIIDPKLAKKLYQKHLSKRNNFSNDIWKLINLELWFREFID